MTSGLTAPAHTRRAFLGAGAVAVAGFALAGCGPDPIAPDRRLAAFVALSRVVTGVRDLPLVHARSYLDALDAAGLEMAPGKLAEAAGYLGTGGPRSLDELMRSPALAKPGAEACARAIAAAWWSGTVTDEAQVTHVVTYDDAVVFQAMRYARPQAQCLGPTGAWSQHSATAAA